MTPKIVSTKEELKSAKEQGITEIIVTGKLANDLKKSKKIALAGTVTIGILTAALVVFKKLCHFLKLLKTGMMHYGNYI